MPINLGGEEVPILCPDGWRNWPAMARETRANEDKSAKAFSLNNRTINETG